MLFEEIVFFVGVICLGVVSFFSSQGGYTSVKTNLNIQAATGMKLEHEEQKVFWNPILAGTVVFIGLSLIIVVVAYFDYFL